MGGLWGRANPVFPYVSTYIYTNETFVWIEIVTSKLVTKCLSCPDASLDMEYDLFGSHFDLDLRLSFILTF